MNQQKRKLFIIISIVILVLISLIISLIIIWNSNKSYSEIASNNKLENTKISSSNIAKYISASSENIDQKNIEQYIDEVRIMLYNKQYEKILEKLDDSFKEKNNLTKYNIKEYMEKNNLVGEEINVIGHSYYKEVKDVYVYRVKYSIGKNIKYFNIIESQPYRYVISFEQEQIPTIINRDGIYRIDDIEFDIEEYRKKEDSISYKIKIINKNKEKIKFDFTSINSIEVMMKDGGTVKQPSSILESDIDYSLNTNSYFSKTFYFPINMQYHKDIIGFNFYNVKIGNITKNIYIRF